MAYTRMEKDGYTAYCNENGTDIAAAEAGVLEQDGFVFRNLEKTGELLPYEDWRLSAEARARDLAGRLQAEEIIGLMLHSSSQPVPAMPGAMENVGTYDGKTFPESDTAKPWDLTDQQKKVITEYGMRHFLVSGLQDVETAVRWTNELQRTAESLPPWNSGQSFLGSAARSRRGSSGIPQWSVRCVTVAGRTGNGVHC